MTIRPDSNPVSHATSLNKTQPSNTQKSTSSPATNMQLTERSIVPEMFNPSRTTVMRGLGALAFGLGAAACAGALMTPVGWGLIGATTVVALIGLGKIVSERNQTGNLISRDDLVAFAQGFAVTGIVVVMVGLACMSEGSVSYSPSSSGESTQTGENHSKNRNNIGE